MDPRFGGRNTVAVLAVATVLSAGLVHAAARAVAPDKDGLATKRSAISASARHRSAPRSAAAAAASAPVASAPTSSAEASGAQALDHAVIPGTMASAAPSRQSTPQTSSGAPRKAGVGRLSSGGAHSGNGTFYGATGGGNCSFDPGGDLMVAAMNQLDYEDSRACGAYVRVTGPRGSVTVKISDRCPECGAGDLDLSRQAFEKIAAVSAGRVKISWTLLSPTLAGSLSYRYKTGSSRFWCGIQVLNHRNPVDRLEVQVKGAWVSLHREPYNYFLSPTGAGCGAAIRVTDVYGQSVTDTGIAIRPDVVQSGRGQFGPPA